MKANHMTQAMIVAASPPTTTTNTRLTLATSTARDSRFLAVDGGRIAYEDTGGNGSLVVAIPGMGDLRSQYRLVRPALVAAGHRVITMDARGFGETSAQWDDFSAHAVGRDALALIDYLDAGPAVILGNSFAAGSALWAAHDAPERVSGVVLLGPITRDARPSWIQNLVLKAGFAGPWRVWFWTTYWQSLFPTKKPADQKEAKAALAQNLRESGRMAALEAMVFLSKAETTAIIPDVRVPALVVMGTRDADFPDATAESNWLSKQLGAESLIVEGAGHYPHTEMPEKVLPGLISFITKAQR